MTVPWLYHGSCALSTLPQRTWVFLLPRNGNCLHIKHKKCIFLCYQDSKFTDAFDPTLKASGVEPVVLPPQSPNLNAHYERFVRSIKEEVVGRMICIGEASLRYALTQYLTHYHAERNHQGLNNQLIVPKPEVSKRTDQVVRRERLGGLLSYYYREAA